MARGKFPKSFKFLQSDSAERYAWLQDASLAVIGTVGVGKTDLAYEIVKGIVASQLTDFSVPEYADFIDASNTSGTHRNKTNALAAYALGYYLEMFPETEDACDIIKCLRQTLHQLESQRDFLNENGLIKDGTNYFTVDNIIAHFAFKQAGEALDEVNYTNTATQLNDAIITTFWKDNSFIKGIGTSGDITDVHLSYLAYGSMFWLCNNDITKAVSLLTLAENFSIIDSVNGAKGYKADIDSTQVWFEGSYAIAVAYYKVGNSSKYRLICAELNKYIDKTDGSNVGTLLKSDFEDTYIDYKAVGSTAWTLIGNKLKSLVFSFRSGTATVGCVRPFFNVEKTQTFSRNNCGSNTTTTPVNYTVQAGRYISYVDQPTADNFALADITANGQAYANNIGVCVSTLPVGNDRLSKTFYSTGCASDEAPNAFIYTVAANTYTAANKAAANQLAQNDIDANGQTAANTANSCSTNAITNFIWIETTFRFQYHVTNIYATVYAQVAVNTDLTVTISTTDNNSNTTTRPPLTIANGQTQSAEYFLYSVPDPDYFSHANVVSLSPIFTNGMTYLFDN